MSLLTADPPSRRCAAALLLGALALAGGTGPAVAQTEPAAGGRFTLGAGMHYSTGKYGAPTATDILYAPLSARYDNDLGAVSLTVPYLSIHGNGEPAGGSVVFDPSSTRQVTSSGLGDVLATAGYTAYRGTAPLPWLDLTAIVKVATADPDKHLGTGENDYALQTDAYQHFGLWNGFATLGYKAPGSPAGLNFQRVFYASAGASHPLAGSFKGGLMWSGQQPLTEGADPQGDIAAFSSWTLSPQYSLHSYLSRGLTRASPDWAVGVTLTRSS